MTQKLFFFDVDGTLVDPSTGKIPASTMKTLKKLQSNGHLVCIATGRPLFHPENPSFFFDFPWDGYVCFNGLAVYDRYHKPIKLYPMDLEAVQKCIQVTTQNDFNLLFQEEREFYLLNDQLTHVTETQRFLNQSIPQKKCYRNQDIYGLMAYAPKGYDYQAYKAIKEIAVFPGQSAYADIVTAGTNKYTGIKECMNYYHLDTYIAFGDSNNDLEMLSHADLSICMGQGTKEAKAFSKYVTAPVDEDGIYQACKHFGFIE